MAGFGIGGVVMGRLADRFGIVMPVMVGAVALGAGYGLSGVAGGIGTFALAQGLLGFGSAATFGPLMTDTSHWFLRRRGIAVAIASSGNYLRARSGRPSSSISFRPTAGAHQIWIGVICVDADTAFAALRAAPSQHSAASHASAAGKLGRSASRRTR
jgi:MFS family permease